MEFRHDSAEILRYIANCLYKIGYIPHFAAIDAAKCDILKINKKHICCAEIWIKDGVLNISLLKGAGLEKALAYLEIEPLVYFNDWLKFDLSSPSSLDQAIAELIKNIKKYESLI